MSLWVTPTFNAAIFTATAFPPSIPGPTWVVGSGDVTTFAYRIIGKTMLLTWHLVTTTVTATPFALSFTIPLGRSAKRVVAESIYISDNGTASTGYASVVGTAITFSRADQSNWATSTNNTGVSGQIEFEVTV